VADLSEALRASLAARGLAWPPPVNLAAAG
jgi:hypothetical protein